MPLPFNIDALIRGEIIESNRLECKRSFNPERVMHTVSAFANDIDNSGGGFIILGIEDTGGTLQITGLEPESLDTVQREIVRVCNYISPRYIPIMDIHETDGKTILILWVPAGHNRPYSAPAHLGDGKGSNRVYYIRRGSSTIEANSNETKDLFDASRNLPFDDSPNPTAELDDIQPYLLSEFLHSSDSNMPQDILRKDPMEVARRMLLTGTVMGVEKPLNVGLMFFNDNPEKFFRYARIEVVDKPDPTGQGMSEKIFRGPIDRQLKDALQFIRNYVLEERIYKRDDVAEADRFFNYPYPAIEEILVNAVYHRNYEIGEPVTVVFESDRLTITSIPGPDRSISDDDLARGRMVSKRYRNRRIGDFLKALHLAEGRNTGIPKAIRALERNGSGSPRFITDADRTYFSVEIPIHPDFIRISTQVKVDRERGLEDRIAELLSECGCLPLREISERLGYSGINRRVKEAVNRMMADGRVEYLYPDKLRSPMQRICLVKGRRRLHYSNICQTYVRHEPMIHGAPQGPWVFSSRRARRRRTT